MPKDLATTVSNWTNSAGTAQQRYVQGIQSTPFDPTQLAIANAPAMVANFNQSVTSGRWQRALAAVGKAGWQAASEAKAGNYATGIQAGAQRYDAAMGTWLPIIHQAAAAVRNMPSGSLAASQARSAAFQAALYNRKRGL